MPEEPKQRKFHPAFHISLGLTLILAITYSLRPDPMTAIHWWPIAFWVPVALLPFLPRFWKHGKGPLTILVLNLAAIAWFDSGWRWLVPASEQAGIRVVSLNCEAGNTEAVREALRAGADVVLLQEVPGDDDVIAEGRAAGYSFAIVAPDTAILSRSPFRETAHEIDFVAGETEVNGQPIKVVSLRLLPPVFRLDLYNPAAWKQYSEDAVRRRDRVREILRRTGPDLIGGDFNTASPALFRKTEFREAAASAGRGWAGTGTNDYPFARVDQIWAGPLLTFTQSFVRKTENSDHRMVVADFEFAK